MRAALAAEWLWLALALGATVAAASGGRWLERLDNVAYDAALVVWQRPASDAVVIVAIDEASLQDVGRWPWTRALHAEAIDRIAAAGAKAILLDLILAEPDSADPAADAALRDAIARAGRVVLPVYAQVGADGSARLVPPQPALAAAAAALGHIHLELDGDGVARRVFLFERNGALALPHLALAAHRVARGQALPPPVWPSAPATALAHEQELLIPFAGPAGHYPRVSYAALLRGEVDPKRLAGRIVLIGATAAGLGDAYPTPLSGQGSVMPGVDVMAGVIDALENDLRVRQVEPVPLAALSLLPLLLLLALLPRLTARAALAATAAAAVLTALLVAAALRAGWWLPPAAALLGLLAVYPLWSWRRLEAAARFLRTELHRHAGDALDARALLAEPHAPPQSAQGAGWRIGDAFARSVDEAQSAVTALRHSRTLFAQSLAGLPAAVVVCDRERRVVLANDAAQALLGLGPVAAPLLDECLAALQTNGAPRRWRWLFERTLADSAVSHEPLRDAAQRAWLVSLAPYARLEGRSVGAIVTLTDVTELQRLQREEREFLQFLSHDLRAPQSSVLSLVDLARGQKPEPPLGALLDRIERQAERSLALMDALLLQQRADRLDADTLQPLDLAQLLHDAADQVWPQAQRRGQHLGVSGTETSAWVLGQHELLLRAVVNLAHNAVKYCGDGAAIALGLRSEGSHWCLSVSDDGPGIAAQHLPRLFERDYRVPRPTAADAVEGSGLGLAFVHTVAERHGGSVTVSSTLGQGSHFSLCLPRHDDPAADDDNEEPA